MGKENISEKKNFSNNFDVSMNIKKLNSEHVKKFYFNK